jgi:excisionase family DNA binding protein
MQFDISPQDQSAFRNNGPEASLRADSLLTVQEVAAILKVPVSWVYERTRRRGNERLPHLKMGKYLRFRHQDIVEWLNSQKI